MIAQDRFVFTTSKDENVTTVVGIRDLTLGDPRRGQGANIIRFNRPSGRLSNFYRICINPGGVKNKIDPHIPVPKFMVECAQDAKKLIQFSIACIFRASVLAALNHILIFPVWSNDYELSSDILIIIVRNVVLDLIFPFITTKIGSKIGYYLSNMEYTPGNEWNKWFVTIVVIGWIFVFLCCCAFAYSVMVCLKNHGFRLEKVGKELYKVDVVGGVIQHGTNHEYRKFGEVLADFLIENEKTAVLISSYEIGHYLLDESDLCESSTSFVFDKQYFITVIENSHLKEYIPDILESEEFVYGLNVWLCLFDHKPSKEDIGTVEEEMTKLIPNPCELYNWKMNIELLAGSSDECEILWLNPQINRVNMDSNNKNEDENQKSYKELFEAIVTVEAIEKKLYETTEKILDVCIETFKF
ncbi:hypothetical protein CRE_23766 [Caenorhabditis remanei]|uniref:Uncharacterized protein n=1 Tax=Caenorhabditis remanei TaxID=31234 RepID=E3NJ41_CAERE|nr:hypothetical protein CRE_23766 [Caenorhabditis remanei]